MRQRRGVDSARGSQLGVHSIPSAVPVELLARVYLNNKDMIGFIERIETR